jgi:hypothetical protein
VRFKRGDRLPDDVKAGLGLQPGERVIASARDADGGWVVATERAMLTVDRRTPWTEVTHAQWHDEEQELTVDLLPGTGPRLAFTFAEPGRMPETVHERVMSSIVMSRRVSLPDGGGARVVARRETGSDDTLWQVVADEGTDLADPAVRQPIDAALARLQAELG